jgi:signal transduction histidine kinase/type II secretory pathway pseudopilin PulG
MKWTKRSLLELIAVLAMTAVVLTLAFLQYRWTRAISTVEQARMEGALEASVKNFNQEFSYDLDRLCESFEVNPDTSGSPAEDRILSRYSAWIKTTSRSDFVNGIYLWRIGGDPRFGLEALDLDNRQFQKSSWPLPLARLQGDFERQATRLPSSLSDQDAEYYPWTFYEEAPALVRPIFQESRGATVADTKVQPTGLLIVGLNGSFLRRVYLPELADRHFGQMDFEIAVRSAKAPYEALYLSSTDFPIATTSPDAAVNLLDSVTEEARRRGHPVVQPSSLERQWQLVARHPSGSLGAAVGSLRRRDLAISLGLISVLAGSLILVFTVARRAERFAKLQMEFVAGVSHELCTPLAVISSAVENLADGIVDNPRQIAEYAGILKDQGGRLERLLDQVLLFASGKFERSEYDLRKIDVGPLVAQSVALSEPILHDAKFVVEETIGDNLPMVAADPAAVSKCIENLIGNAVKYAGDERWLGVRTVAVNGSQLAELQVRVEDKGMGIPAGDLPHVFEPFYRVQSVRDGQIRGVGLGLHLVKRMMEGMGGSVSVTSELGRGTCFVLHFPVTDSGEEKAGGPKAAVTT